MSGRHGLQNGMDKQTGMRSTIARCVAQAVERGQRKGKQRCEEGGSRLRGCPDWSGGAGDRTRLWDVTKGAQRIKVFSQDELDDLPGALGADWLGEEVG